jgi:hypothetical protein
VTSARVPDAAEPRIEHGILPHISTSRFVIGVQQPTTAKDPAMDARLKISDDATAAKFLKYLVSANRVVRARRCP